MIRNIKKLNIFPIKISCFIEMIECTKNCLWIEFEYNKEIETQIYIQLT